LSTNGQKEMEIFEDVERIRAKKPLVHHITNWVTIYDCAQVTRSIGALPVMAHADEEVEEMVSLASALVLNIGTLTPGLIESMIRAGKSANERGIPVILDAVGVGATGLRTDSTRKILKEVKVSVLKGNAGEIATLADVPAEVRGVESISADGHVKSIAEKLASDVGSVVVVTGPLDVVSDGERSMTISNGHSMMGQVVGTGCMSASMLGAFASVSSDHLVSSAKAMAAFGVAGEKAADISSGPMDFKMRLLDEVASLSKKDDEMVKIELQDKGGPP